MGALGNGQARGLARADGGMAWLGRHSQRSQSSGGVGAQRPSARQMSGSKDGSPQAGRSAAGRAWFSGQSAARLQKAAQAASCTVARALCTRAAATMHCTPPTAATRSLLGGEFTARLHSAPQASSTMPP